MINKSIFFFLTMHIITTTNANKFMCFDPIIVAYILNDSVISSRQVF